MKMLALQTPAYKRRLPRTLLQPQNPRSNLMVKKAHSKLEHTRRIKVFACKKTPIYSITAAKAKAKPKAELELELELECSNHIPSGYQQELIAIWHKKLLDKISEVLLP
jgi:hypothetical protein